MIVVKNKHEEYLCSVFKNSSMLSNNRNSAMVFDTVEEAKLCVWHFEWEQMQSYLF